MRISDWSSDVCSSDLISARASRIEARKADVAAQFQRGFPDLVQALIGIPLPFAGYFRRRPRPAFLPLLTMPASTVPFHDRSLYKKYYIDCDIVIGRGNIERRERNRSPVQLDGGALQELAYKPKIPTPTLHPSPKPKRQKSVREGK